MTDQEIVENVLTACARFSAFPERFRTLTVFDRPNGQFLLLDEGWDGFKHIHRVWVHIELRDGTFWVQKDGTEDGIAVDLLNASIPKERIVLSCLPPLLKIFQLIEHVPDSFSALFPHNQLNA